ncbi:hypothetical protein EVG20_g695 [Dentipellis fragilis]|uniref:Xylanolytic transcriptional activator regulatory domain-containing protein n=1 Tax=Dentipellis fragilis TaxID=205917 RepID=A0A4Y9ZBZ2_9AGAM|nr:hypothetical protein EVG20_g695 [Dentipellis fragilis]
MPVTRKFISALINLFIGSLTTGQGNRFVLASTQELHEKITELCSRIRDLEDGLRVSHSQSSSEPHSLLSDDLLRVKAPLQRETLNQNSTITHHQEEEHNPDVVDAYGTLSISETGHTKYYGQFANSWYFLQNEHVDDETPEDIREGLRNLLPAEILDLSGFFPVSPVTLPSFETLSDRIRNLYWYLPGVDKAGELRDIYFSHAAWMYNPVPESEFNANVFYPIFRSQKPSPPPDESLAVLSHQLALMFMVLAIGSLMDARLPAYNLEAEKYHQLAKAALFQTDIFNGPTIETVQSLYLMTFYLFLADRHGCNGGSRWAIMGMAVKLAQSIGLHRDTARWNVEPEEVRRRRELFWELLRYMTPGRLCLTFGRPPAFTMAQVDCQMPHPKDPTSEQAFHAWKHRFSSDCMSVVHDQAFGAKTPTYATILQLDRKLRACAVPEVLQIAGFGNSSEPRLGAYPESVPLILQRHIVLAIREMNLLYMHRSFFARALSDHPKDPLGSPYGTSVIAAYRSAGSLVALMRNLHSLLKDPVERMWFLWTHMFSCAIILGSIVTRCPSMSLAPSALVQLDSACDLFGKAARGFRAEKVLDIMVKLREKAHLSLQAFRDGKSSVSRNSSASEPQTSADEEDELFTLGGKTRLVAKKEPGSPSSISPCIINHSPGSLNPVVPLPLANGPQDRIHPSVFDYLRTFVPPSGSNAHGELASARHDVFSESPGDRSLANFGAMDVHLTQLSNRYPTVPPPGGLSTQPQPMLDLDFPQYFPVFDYGQTMVDTYTPLGLPSEDRHRRTLSSTPEATMQGTWQDFVAQLSMN